MRYPSYLLRAFTDKTHAKDFLRGKMRLGNIKYYKNHEDLTRRDASEGDGRLKISTDLQEISYDSRTLKRTGINVKSGLMDYSHYFGTPTYILCTSGPEVSIKYLKQTGNYIVRIKEPYQFLLDLKEYFLGKTKSVFLEKIRYDKDAIVSAYPKFEKRYKLSFTQKPFVFKKDREYRYVFILPPPQTEDFTYIDFKKRLDYVEWL